MFSRAPDTTKALLLTALPTLIPKLDANPDADLDGDLDADTDIHSDASGAQEQDDVFNWQQAFHTMGHHCQQTNKMMSEAMANRRKDEKFQADMTTFSTNAQAQINDLKKNYKAKDSRMDKFQAQLNKIGVRSLSNEKRIQKILKQLGPKHSHKTMGTDTDDGALRRNILRASLSGICLWDITA